LARTLSIEQIASEVGRLFGTTEVHARRWLEQRKELLNALIVVRDKANGLITELGGGTPLRLRRRDRQAKPGIPVVQPGMRESRRKRVVSAATRAKMRAAAKKRWAGIKRAAKKRQKNM
jgi:hypothetical protein